MAITNHHSQRVRIVDQPQLSLRSQNVDELRKVLRGEDAEVNQLFGDIVKVTPSSKVVGDMALFLFSRGIKPPARSILPAVTRPVA